MKKSILLLIALTLVIAVFALSFAVRSDAESARPEDGGQTVDLSALGPAIWLILLLAIFYPIVCAANAILAGLAAKPLWYIPIITALLFPLCARITVRGYMDGGWVLLCLFSLIYLVGGILVMLLTAFLKKRLGIAWQRRKAAKKHTDP